MSRNTSEELRDQLEAVTSREGRVSRNMTVVDGILKRMGHVPRGACE